MKITPTNHQNKILNLSILFFWIYKLGGSSASDARQSFLASDLSVYWGPEFTVGDLFALSEVVYKYNNP
jgi:hypothetical protein